MDKKRTLKHRRRVAAASFAVTAILLATALGFTAVDISTDKYMPGQFGRLFVISEVTADGAGFTFLGQAYRLDITGARAALERLEGYRGLFPPAARIARGLTERITLVAAAD